MITFKRVCIKDHTIEDTNGDSFTLKRTKEYTTSPIREEDNTIMVFSTYWVRVPVDLFAGEVRFT